jgi:hypothetical protein
VNNALIREQHGNCVKLGASGVIQSFRTALVTASCCNNVQISGVICHTLQSLAESSRSGVRTDSELSPCVDDIDDPLWKKAILAGMIYRCDLTIRRISSVQRWQRVKRRQNDYRR